MEKTYTIKLTENELRSVLSALTTETMRLSEKNRTNYPPRYVGLIERIDDVANRISSKLQNIEYGA